VLPTPIIYGIPRPAGLYRPEDLLGGWTADDPLSYATTIDARTLRAAAADGLRIPVSDDVARDRALHDLIITRDLHRAIADRQVVAIMGGHKLARGGEEYGLAAEIARRLAGDGYLVVSGGGPGAMEAAHLGARLSASPTGELAEAMTMLAEQPVLPGITEADLIRPDGSFDEDVLRLMHAWQAPAFAVAERWPDDSTGSQLRSIGIPTWLYGHEPPTPLASRVAKYFENSIREDGLLAIATAGIFYAQGSAGTLQEVFQDAAQNFYGSVDGVRSPMVFLDVGGCWTIDRPVGPLLNGLFDVEQERLVHFVTTADDAVAAIVDRPG
jgi:predicted Rossmann-fold nucleotide-binding protein